MKKHSQNAGECTILHVDFQKFPGVTPPTPTHTVVPIADGTVRTSLENRMHLFSMYKSQTKCTQSIEECTFLEKDLQNCPGQG